MPLEKTPPTVPENHGAEEALQEMPYDASIYLASKQERNAQEAGEHADELEHIESELEHADEQEMENVCMDYLLSLAQIPGGDFKYGGRFKEILFTRGRELKAMWNAHEAKSAQFLLEFAKHAEASSTLLLQQFLQDNLPADSYKRFQAVQWERLKKTVDLQTIADQLHILEYITKNDEQAAQEFAEKAILRRFFGNDETMSVTNTMQSIVKKIAITNVLLVRKTLYPLLQSTIEEYAKKGYIQSFKSAAVNTGKLAWDWVRTPFNEEARERMAETLTPAFEMSNGNDAGNYMALLPIIKSIATSAFNTSLSQRQLINVARSLAGTLSFDALLLLTPMAVGSAAKGAQVTARTGTSLRAVSGAMKGLRAMKSLRLPYIAAISVSALRHKADIQRQFEQ